MDVDKQLRARARVTMFLHNMEYSNRDFRIDLEEEMKEVLDVVCEWLDGFTVGMEEEKESSGGVKNLVKRLKNIGKGDDK